MMAQHPPQSAGGDPFTSPLSAARALTARGWVVFPADHPDAGLHCTGTPLRCRQRKCKGESNPADRGKCPRVLRWGELREPVSDEQLITWFGDDKLAANVAVAAGPSGLFIVDEDVPDALSGYAESIGEKVPDTFRVSSSRGWHYYFARPPDAVIGNSPGALKSWHCDVRGGASASGEHGGYAITAGSISARDGQRRGSPEPYAPVLPMPDWLIEAVQSPVVVPPTDPGEGNRDQRAGLGSGSPRDVARWDDATRYGTRADLLGQFERHCAEVLTPGGEFRHELYRAARDGWRLVALGVLTEDTMFAALEACVRRVWDAEPDDRDRTIVEEEAYLAAQRSPWELTTEELRAGALERSKTDHPSGWVGPGDLTVVAGHGVSDRTTDGNRAVSDAQDSTQRESLTEEDRYARKLADAIEKERLRRDARDALDAAELPPLLLVRPSQRKERPRASYLVPRMIYRNGITVIFGETGSGKSYFILDIALSMATGKPWREHRITTATGERGMVHYVMAEGEDANNGRIDAWHHHHGTSDADIEDHFAYIPMVIMLTEAGIRSYLPVVREDQPDLIILDTRNLMFDGNEAAGGDYGAMLRILRKLQEEAGGCAIVVLDHPGLTVPTRTRGSNAQKGGADSELLVTKADGLHTVEVTKDRSADLSMGTYWHYRLHQVNDVPRDEFVDPPAVCIEAQRDPMITAPDWWMDELPEELGELIQKSRLPAKRTAAEIMRVLRKVSAENSYSVTEIDKMLRERPRKRGEKYWSISTVRNALELLADCGAVETTGTDKAPKWLLSRTWRST